MIPKDTWQKGMAEGKSLAGFVIAKSRELKAFSTASPNSPPTDRELLLAAAVNVFWDYKLQQEASAAARRITIEKTLGVLDAVISGGTEYEFASRVCRKALRRVAAKTEGYGFLMMWGLVDRFLQVAANPEYWKQEEFKSDPSIAIRALISDLDRVAAQGESNGQEKGSNEVGTPGGATGTEGNQDQVNGAAVCAEVGRSGETQPGENGSTEGVRGGGEGMETEAGGVQEPNKEP